MPLFAPLVPALVGALAGAMASFAGRVLLSLGVGFVTYKGIDLSIAALRDMVVTSMKGMPADVLNLVAWLYIDKALTVIFSAVVTALALRMVGGSMKKMVVK